MPVHGRFHGGPRLMREDGGSRDAIEGHAERLLAAAAESRQEILSPLLSWERVRDEMSVAV